MYSKLYWIIALLIAFSICVFRGIQAETAENLISLEKQFLNTQVTDRIHCFDVNDEYVAIGFIKDRIDFYDIDTFDYQFSFTFQISGGYSFNFIENDICIVDYRNSFIAIYNKEGKVQNVLRDSDNLQEIHRLNQLRHEIELNGSIYQVIGKGDNYQIDVIKGDVRLTVFSFTDDSIKNFLKTIYMVSCIILIASVVPGAGIYIYIRIKNKKHNKP